VESALDHIRLLEEHDFREYKVASKGVGPVPGRRPPTSSSPRPVDCPLHLGITEAAG
jgi:(E)-4-hydroxy-3-methylbut-2-enyl-diphosphate synthase